MLLRKRTCYYISVTLPPSSSLIVSVASENPNWSYISCCNGGDLIWGRLAGTGSGIGAVSLVIPVLSLLISIVNSC